jgi:uncharacterized protein (DUF58 family)
MISKQIPTELSSLPPHSDGVNLNLEELLQYKQQSVHWQPPAKSLWTQLLGQHQSRQLGRGMDFSEVRQYQAGDDIRTIDWRVTARTGKPHTKLFSEEREKPVVLYLDMSRSMLFGSKLMLKSVQMSHMASLIAWLSVTKQDRIGAIIDTGDAFIELRPTSRQKGVLAILQQLIAIHRQQLQTLLSTNANFTDHRMDAPLKALARMCPKGSEIIMISDFADISSLHKPLLNQLCRHNQMRMVQISDPLEYGATHYRGTQQVSDQYRKKYWLNFGSQKTRNQLEVAFNQHQQQLKQMAQSLGISFSSVSTDRALTHQLHGQ